MSADTVNPYQSCSTHQSGGAQWRGCAPGEPWKLVEILANGFGLYRVLANRPRRPWLEILAKEIRVSWDIVSFGREKWGNRANWASGRWGFAANNWQGFASGSTGNRAFDAWRATELARLEEEHKRLAAAEREFADYM